MSSLVAAAADVDAKMPLSGLPSFWFPAEGACARPVALLASSPLRRGAAALSPLRLGFRVQMTCVWALRNGTVHRRHPLRSRRRASPAQSRLPRQAQGNRDARPGGEEAGTCRRDRASAGDRAEKWSWCWKSVCCPPCAPGRPGALCCLPLADEGSGGRSAVSP